MNLTERQLAVLNHVVTDGQVWADNAKVEAHVLTKVTRWESDYDTAFAKGNYQTRKQRDDAEEVATQERYDNVTYDVKRKREYPTIEECVHAILDDEIDALQIKRQAVKQKYPKENS
jgi:hypothetical protein